MSTFKIVAFGGLNYLNIWHLKLYMVAYGIFDNNKYTQRGNQTFETNKINKVYDKSYGFIHIKHLNILNTKYKQIYSFVLEFVRISFRTIF